jgi:hypothetical protein
MKMNKRLVPAMLLWAACGAAGAQIVWRCGSTYSQAPCAQGVPVAASDARSAAQAQEAAAAARRDAKTADSMEKTRLAQQAKAAPAGVIGQPAGKAPQAAAEARPHKPKHGKKKAEPNPDLFTAVTPGEKKKKPAKK